MSYEDRTIKEIIEMIGSNEIYLPAIQRKLVWKHEQIERLFDSIMRNYPIGTFLFWKLKKESANKYTFYKFIQEYKYTPQTIRNEVAPSPIQKDEIYGILDGQQRLNSMYIALQGSYAYKKPRARWNNPLAFPKRNLYLNLLYTSKKEDIHNCEECGEEVPWDTKMCPNCGNQFEEEYSDVKYDFKFLTEEESKEINENVFWFTVKNVLKWKDVNGADDYFEEIVEIHPKLNIIFDDKEKKKMFRNTLFRLWQMITSDKIISYYEVKEQDLESILAIFVRVNSGGTILSKTDLLFSTIVAHWEEARDEIEEFLMIINKKGDGFNFGTDFIMRSCLVLTDCPVLFKVQTFKRDNIKRIKDEWEEIKISIENTINLLVEFGLNRENLTSQMSVIPIAYYFKKKGKDYKVDEKNKVLMREYLLKSLLRQVYGGQGDQVLSKIRDSIREEDAPGNYSLKYIDFPFDDIKVIDLPSRKSFNFTDEDIEEILNRQKGPYTFMILSLLYPNLKFDQVKFHQDHIHPASGFSDKKLKDQGILLEKWEDWKDKKDNLPNLQLMEGRENISKQDKPFFQWLSGYDGTGCPNVKDKDKFLNDNYIPNDISLEFLNFDEFYDKRREMLKEEIKKVLYKV